jgi:nucleotide-binding universal stress UspA family protein
MDMKTIIAATDYSVPATNAAWYGAALAQSTGARLIVYHAFYFQETFSRILIDVPTLGELRAEHQSMLESLKKDMIQSFPIELHCETGTKPLEDDLPNQVIKYQADLVVIGTTHTNVFNRLVYASSVSTLLQKAHFPLLIVPESARFHGIKHILFAYDAQPVHSHELMLLKNIGFELKAQIHLLHVQQKEPALTDKYSRGVQHNKQQLDELLQEVPHQFVGMEEKDIADAIMQTVRDYQIDILVMMPHQHSFWNRIFHTSVTIKMSYLTEVPILTIQNQQ